MIVPEFRVRTAVKSPQLEMSVPTSIGPSWKYPVTYEPNVTSSTLVFKVEKVDSTLVKVDRLIAPKLDTYCTYLNLEADGTEPVVTLTSVTQFIPSVDVLTENLTVLVP